MKNLVLSVDKVSKLDQETINKKMENGDWNVAYTYVLSFTSFGGMNALEEYVTDLQIEKIAGLKQVMDESPEFVKVPCEFKTAGSQYIDHNGDEQTVKEDGWLMKIEKIVITSEPSERMEAKLERLEVSMEKEAKLLHNVLA